MIFILIQIELIFKERLYTGPHFESEGFGTRKWPISRNANSLFLFWLLFHSALQNWANQSSTQTRVTGRKRGKTHRSDSRWLVSYWLKSGGKEAERVFLSFFLQTRQMKMIVRVLHIKRWANCLKRTEIPWPFWWFIYKSKALCMSIFLLLVM